jgi:hypothetical protein
LHVAGPAQAVRLPKRALDLTIKSVSKLQSGGPTGGRFYLREERMKHCILLLAVVCAGGKLHMPNAGPASPISIGLSWYLTSTCADLRALRRAAKSADCCRQVRL